MLYFTKIIYSKHNFNIKIEDFIEIENNNNNNTQLLGNNNNNKFILKTKVRKIVDITFLEVIMVIFLFTIISNMIYHL